MGKTAKNDFLTTGKAAKAAGVDIKTLGRWADDGLISGCYQLPSKHRRISRSGLIKFLKSLGIPVTKELAR